jgi:hypothetical protein
VNAKELLRALAEKLRSRATWQCRDGYYTTELESATNGAIRDTLEGIASDIAELLLPEGDPCSKG